MAPAIHILSCGLVAYIAIWCKDVIGWRPHTTPGQSPSAVKMQETSVAHAATGAANTIRVHMKDILEQRESLERGENPMMYRFLSEEDHYGAFLVGYQRNISRLEEVKMQLLLNFEKIGIMSRATSTEATVAQLKKTSIATLPLLEDLAS